MSTLNIQLLGGFNLSLDGSPVTGFHQPRLQALLAYLLLNRHTPQSRQSIAFRFWPNSTEKQSRTNLRRLLYSLRQALPQSDHYLQITTETLYWRSGSPYVLDVAQFETYAAKSQDDGSQSGAHLTISELDTLYAGDLLPGFYEEWILEERERLRTLFASSLTKLAAQYEAERDYGAAVAAARRLLILDALQESSYRLLMHLHLLNDDRAAALTVYHRCATTLREELGVDPSPLTEEIYLRVLQVTKDAEVTALPVQAYASFPLIGRHREWGRLQRAWQQAQKGQPTLCLIQGEAGVGKTRLAQELADMVRRQGMAAMHTRAYAAEGAGPYAPLIDLLRSEGQTAALAKLEKVWLAELSRLLPELRSGSGEMLAPKPMTEAWQQHRFHEALARGVLAARQPLLISFDDLQWCDLETLAWLRFLLAYDHRTRLLVVGTVRNDEINEEHPLNLLRYDMEQQGRCRVMTLDPLEPEEVAQLAARVIGKNLSPALGEKLFAETEGNPLFVVETLRADVIGGSIHGVAWWQDATSKPKAKRRLPPKVQAVIQWRLSQLASEARQLASTAAVIGRNFSHDLLASVSELSDQSLVRYLDELWRRRIIREGELGTYDFSHDLIREVAFSQLSPMQRRYLHQRVAQALEVQQVADLGPVASRIANHYGQAGDNERARLFFDRAGRYAAAQFANGEAVGYFSRALELTKQDEAPSEELAALYARLGRALELDSQFDRAMALYQEMESLARQRRDHSMQLASLVNQVTLLATPTPVHDPIQGEVLAEQALTLARRLDDLVAEAKILWTLILVYGYTDRISETTASGERALALARKLNQREQMAFALNDLGYHCYKKLGRLDQAREVLDEASELWRELDNLPMLADSLSALCAITMRTGEYEQALAFSEEAYQISQSIDNLWGQSDSLVDVGWVHWEHGRPDRAIATMEECIRLGEMTGFLGGATTTRALLCLVYADLGAIEQSLETSRQAVSVAETQFPSELWYVLGMLAQLHLMHGHLAEAEVAIEQVKHGSPRRDRGTWSINSAEGELALKQGHYKRAMAITEELLADLRRSKRRSDLPHALYLQGQILQATDQTDAARQCFREAREVAEALGSQRMLWRVLFALSRLEADPIEAQRLHQQAREILEYIANHAGSPALQTSFLNRPEVRDVLA